VTSEFIGDMGLFGSDHFNCIMEVIGSGIRD